MKTATRALAIVVAMTTVAQAQSPAAEALFRKAKKLMKQKAFAAACDKFEASERLEPTIGTELNLADCREKNGQLATAWAAFIKVAQTAKHSGDKKREAEARRRVDALEPRLVYLTISVPRPARLAGLVIRRSGALVDAAAYDQPVPVDADEYQITAEAPGHERWQHTISIGKTSKTIDVPTLDAAAPEPQEPQAPPARTVEPAARVPEPSPWTSKRKTAAVISVVGVAAGIAGVALGLHANDLESQSDARCPTVRCNDETAIERNRSARTEGTLANIGMIGGGALVVGAVVLWILDDRKPRDRVSIMPGIGPSGIALEGRF